MPAPWACQTCTIQNTTGSGNFCSQECFDAGWLTHKLQHITVPLKNRLKYYELNQQPSPSPEELAAGNAARQQGRLAQFLPTEGEEYWMWKCGQLCRDLESNLPNPPKGVIIVPCHLLERIYTFACYELELMSDYLERCRRANVPPHAVKNAPSSPAPYIALSSLTSLLEQTRAATVRSPITVAGSAYRWTGYNDEHCFQTSRQRVVTLFILIINDDFLQRIQVMTDATGK